MGPLAGKLVNSKGGEKQSVHSFRIEPADHQNEVPVYGPVSKWLRTRVRPGPRAIFAEGNSPPRPISLPYSLARCIQKHRCPASGRPLTLCNNCPQGTFIEEVSCGAVLLIGIMKRGKSDSSSLSQIPSCFDMGPVQDQSP